MPWRSDTAMAQRRRGLRIDDAGISVGGRFLVRFTATWAELAAIEIEPRQARIVRRDGRARTIDFADLRNEADVRAALEGARLRLAPPEPDEPPAESPADVPAS